MNTSALRDDTIAAEWTLAAEERGHETALPVDVGEWGPHAEIRAEIFLPDDARGEIRCDLELPSRAEGFAANDGYWFNALVSPRAGNIWRGWREFRMPAECFYTRGIPAGWQRPRSASLAAPEGSRIRAVRLVSRRMAQGPRMRDEAFLDAVDLDAPAMAAARRARDRGDVIEALQEAVSAIRRSEMDRRSPQLRAPAEEPPEAAEAVLAGRIMGQDWSAGIDWNANPVGYIEWSIRIHCLDYLSTLARAWRRTRDERFARGIERIVADWMRSNPVPVGVRAGGLAWGHSLVVAIRAFGPLLDCLDALLRWPGSGWRTIVDLLKSLWEHAEYLLAFESFPPSNKTIAEGRTIATLGCALPELRPAAEWRRRGFQRLLEDMDIQVMGDGASYELTPNYQIAIADWFMEAREVARKSGVVLDPRYEERLRAMYAWSTAVARPDGTRPSVSDAGSADAAYGELLAGPARILGDPAALWVGSRGAEGARPEVGSVALKDSGYFLMRSGWDREALCMLFEAGPFGRFHQHEDMLSFDLYARGSPFIVDPGITSYLPDPWTSFYRSTEAHNTVLVDGRAQARRSTQGVEEWTRSARESTRWRSGDRFDAAVGCYNAGYAGLDVAVEHRRAVLFAKPDYFLILDELTGEGAHLCEALFHFMPYRVEIDRTTGAVRTVRQDAPNLEVRPLTPMRVRLVCGVTEPVQGWVSLGGQDVPAPVAIFGARGRLPLRTGYLLVPFGADRVTAGLSTRLSRRGERWTIDVALASGRRDRIVMDWRSPDGPVLEG